MGQREIYYVGRLGSLEALEKKVKKLHDGLNQVLNDIEVLKCKVEPCPDEVTTKSFGYRLLKSLYMGDFRRGNYEYLE
jgi:hypothetical protein